MLEIKRLSKLRQEIAEFTQQFYAAQDARATETVEQQ